LSCRSMFRIKDKIIPFFGGSECHGAKYPARAEKFHSPIGIRSNLCGIKSFAGAIILTLLAFSSLAGQKLSASPLSPEKLVYPLNSICLLNVRGEIPSYPFQLKDFQTELISYLRSADYLTVKTEEELGVVFSRNRVSVPDLYDSQALARICRLTDCDYVVFMKMIALNMNLNDGFTIPVLFHRNKVTFRAELDVAVIERKTGALQYSEKIHGKKSLGRGIQIYPVTEDPSNYLNFRQRETLARQAMQDLARQTFESLLFGIHKKLGVKYICYWQDEVHIIADKPGLCPICGSRLVKIMR